MRFRWRWPTQSALRGKREPDRYSEDDARAGQREPSAMRLPPGITESDGEAADGVYGPVTRLQDKRHYGHTFPTTPRSWSRAPSRHRGKPGGCALGRRNHRRGDIGAGERAANPMSTPAGDKAFYALYA